MALGLLPRVQHPNKGPPLAQDQAQENQRVLDQDQDRVLDRPPLAFWVL